MRLVNRHSVVCLPLVFVLGCGGGDDPAPTAGGSAPAPAAPTSTPSAPAATPAASTASSGPQTWDGTQGVAEVTGTVSFSGAAPERAPLDMGADPVCHDTGGGALDESVIVNDGKLQNAFIYVSKGADDWKFETPSEPVSLNQEGCLYKPHVLGMMKGQTLSVTNADGVTHNVHTYSRKNASFNKSQPAGAGAIEQAMKRDEKLFPVKCDIHSWMSAYICVVDNPFFAVSDENGNFNLGSLPEGTYTLTAEHETLGSQKAEVTVSASGADAVSFTFGG